VLSTPLQHLRLAQTAGVSPGQHGSGIARCAPGYRRKQAQVDEYTQAKDHPARLMCFIIPGNWLWHTRYLAGPVPGRLDGFLPVRRRE